MATTENGERGLELQRQSFRFRCNYPVRTAELTDRIAYDVDISFLLNQVQSILDYPNLV